MKSEPLTIRLNDSLVSTLKEEARRISYEQNKDVLYTDLIRDAIQEFTSGIEKSAIISSCDVSLDSSLPSEILPTRYNVLSGISDVLTPDTTEDEWLEMFGFRRNALSIAIQDGARPIFEEDSLPRAIMNKVPYSPGQSFDRDVCSIVYVISRRGAIADQIQEGDTYLAPTFQIACNPSIRIEKILDRDINSVADLSLKSAASMAKEETSNFCCLIEQAGMGREPITVQSITLDALSQGYNLLVHYGHTPKHLVVSPVTYTKLCQEAASKKGNWQFDALQMNNKPVGHYQGAVIRVTDRIYSDCENAYFFAENAGNLVEKIQLTCLMNATPCKLRGSIIMWIDIGMSMPDTELTCVTTQQKSD